MDKDKDKDKEKEKEKEIESGVKLSIAILNGEYSLAKEILEKDNINVNQYYVCWDKMRQSNAFEDCYRNMQRIEIAKLVSDHHTFNPNEKSVSLGSEPNMIDILEFFVKIYESHIMELTNGQLDRKSVV